MAEDKRSFILYSDLLSVVEKLISEDRKNSTNRTGELFYHILEYVNDRDPEPKDFIVEMTFEPIKLQLKRDLKKYEYKKSERSNNGAYGNLKRWHSDLYELVKKGDITLEKAVNIASSRNKSHSDDSDRPQSLTIANIAVNGNGNGNDSVNVNDTVNDNDKESIQFVSAENKFSSTKKNQKTFDERKEAFREKIDPFREKYDREMLNEFWRYWTEKNENGKKMRFEMQKVFDVGRRLATWHKNDKNQFNGKQKQFTGSQSRQQRVDEVREFRLANQQAIAERLSQYISGDSE